MLSCACRDVKLLLHFSCEFKWAENLLKHVAVYSTDGYMYEDNQIVIHGEMYVEGVLLRVDAQ